MFAKAMCYANKKPIIPVNHLEAHILISRMKEKIEFPFLALLISGGHCQLVLAKDVGSYQKLGETLDDSLGEAFDKVSRMLGLGYPGGKAVEERALRGRGDRFLFPVALKGRAGSDFSFSGLKTAVHKNAPYRKL